MRKVSLVQVNFQQGPLNLNAYYLPYSIGCLWSYANSFPEVQEQYQLDHVLWRRDDVDTTAQRLADQDLVAFSCYIWNRNYNYALAERVKKINPECMIVFGGPEPPITNKDIFRSYPYIDAVIKREGELIFKDLLCNLHDAEKVPGLLINQGGEILDTGDSPRIDDLDILPSPYLSGFFDRLIQEHPDIEWMSTLETNRGCPYQCTFCDWGSLTYSKIKLFSLDKVFGELEWISRNRCGTIYVADANFGIFPQRDNQIVDKFKQLQNEYGYPYYWSTTWAKNQKQEVINIIRKLCDNSKFYNIGLNVSLQSLNDDVLLNIKRKNMHDMAVKDMFRLAEKKQIPVWTELILGLPGETLESWKENFYQMFRMDVHGFADVAICQLLENAEMNLVQKEIYDIKTTEVYDYLSGTYNVDEWTESISIVTSTANLPPPDMVDAIVFTWFITTFHMQYFSNLISRFLFKHADVDYQEFYDRLLAAVKSDAWFMAEIDTIKNGIQIWFTKGKMEHPDLANGIKIHSWNLFNATAMKIHLESRYDHVFSMVHQVASSFDVNTDVVDAAMELQKSIVIDFHDLAAYPKIKQFPYNIYDVIVEDQELHRVPQTLKFDFKHEKNSTFKEYIERIFYSRKIDFAKSLVEKLPQT